MALTASTGTASQLLVGAVTLHSWSGMKTGIRGVDMIVNELQRSGGAARWAVVKVLILDEGSMVSGDTLDLVSGVAWLQARCYCFFGADEIFFHHHLLQ